MATKMSTNSLQLRRLRKNVNGLSLNDTDECPNFTFNMDLNGYSSVGTQTPTDDRTFDFPECFSPSPTMSRSSLSSSSIGTQTGVRQRLSSIESPTTTDSSVLGQSQPRPKLFRRHSTGSDVYNFGTSPTLIAFGGSACGNKGSLSNRMLMEELTSAHHRGGRQSAVLEDSQEDLESIGQQLRKIGDDLDRGRGGSFRARTLSMSRFVGTMNRRTSNQSNLSSSVS